MLEKLRDQLNSATRHVKHFIEKKSIPEGKNKAQILIAGTRTPRENWASQISSYFSVAGQEIIIEAVESHLGLRSAVFDEDYESKRRFTSRSEFIVPSVIVLLGELRQYSPESGYTSSISVEEGEYIYRLFAELALEIEALFVFSEHDDPSVIDLHPITEFLNVNPRPNTVRQ